MDYKHEAVQAVAFFDAVRVAMDGAEMGVVMGWEKENPATILQRTLCQMEVAARNLKFAIERVQVIAFVYERENKNGASVDGVSAGRTVVSTKKVGRDSLSKSAARAR
jgi:hypothetical protein